MRPARSCFRAAAILLFLVALSSCIATGPAGEKQPEGLASDHVPRIRLMAESKEVVDEYTFPPESTRQVFSWGNFGAEWRVRMADRRYAYAGFFFEYPYDFTRIRKRAALSFRLKPTDAARHLSIAFVDGHKTSPRVMADVPLAKYQRRERVKWGLYSIALTEFGLTGVALETTTKDSQVIPLDWSDICEIRLTALSKRTWDDEIIIRDMQFGPLPLSAQSIRANASRPWQAHRFLTAIVSGHRDASWRSSSGGVE